MMILNSHMSYSRTVDFALLNTYYNETEALYLTLLIYNDVLMLENKLGIPVLTHFCTDYDYDWYV